MSNKEIIKAFRLAGALAELYDEESKLFNSAVFNLERVATQLVDKDPAEMQPLGLTRWQAQRVYELIQTGSFAELKAYMDKTPLGVLEILNIKGLGGKKVGILWKELGIDNIPMLQAACVSGKVAQLKGFGEKTQAAILQQINFLLANSGRYHLNDAEAIAQSTFVWLSSVFPRVEVVGQLARSLEVIDKMEFLVEVHDGVYHEKLEQMPNAIYQMDKSGPYTWRGKINNFDTVIHFSEPEQFVGKSLVYSSTPRHIAHNGLRKIALSQRFENQDEIYQKAGLPYFPPELREGMKEFEFQRKYGLSELVNYSDLKGILHNHSTYSDGKHTLEEMAVACRDLGFEYLGITDHSKSAFYANGMNEAAVARQHREIELLNQKLAPFKIFKGVEADILIDGSLDYEQATLQEFDFVVASVHSVLNMPLTKATDRLIKAIQNPYTSILGHPTGRLLLKREGYPIDYRAVIDACAAYHVAIELNSHPWRLDLDWRWVQYAVDKQVNISVNPDAHEKEGYAYMVLGTRIARKGCLPRSLTLNAMNSSEIADFFAKQKLLKK